MVIQVPVNFSGHAAQLGDHLLAVLAAEEENSLREELTEERPAKVVLVDSGIEQLQANESLN